MFTSFDKAIAGLLAPGIVAALNAILGVTTSEETAIAIAGAITALIVYFVPNKS